MVQMGERLLSDSSGRSIDEQIDFDPLISFHDKEI